MPIVVATERSAQRNSNPRITCSRTRNHVQWNSSERGGVRGAGACESAVETLEDMGGLEGFRNHPPETDFDKPGPGLKGDLLQAYCDLFSESTFFSGSAFCSLSTFTSTSALTDFPAGMTPTALIDLEFRA